ncbi:anti-sigma factor family protein [Cerasicoccus arenae]|uniref:Uncharacterized protein n=1 Tax=Cerasicoccus arenae TaxID=424488 RepID=A0A8J3DHT7_9BACT|nr:hypothetical protein [Cerasicoccus arenae]MBK1858941.1 hypothetical protein [Cerasicoccus arenae]GHC03983.1 hypothetical protein GCM10007047_20760 [Cerasicoccus arenae]
MKDSDAELLTRYFDGECPPTEKAAAEHLLREDPDAAEWLAKMAEQQQQWRELPSVLSEDDITSDWQSLQARLFTAEPETEQPKVINWMAWSRYWTWGAAAAVFALASVIFLFPRSEPSLPRSPYNAVDLVETDLEGATPIVYVDKLSGWSVVWVDESPAG